ncbi:ankyrin repeat domain-containing protein [Sarocladium implicatum]|nr:ankyrin repeat domain-containing protein [Sarocladium implicatum]
MPVKPGYVQGQDQNLTPGHDQSNEHRPATPAKYKPAEAKSDSKPAAAIPAAAAAAAPAPAPAAQAPAAGGSALPAALAAGAPKGAAGLASFMPNMPTALAAYAGWQFLTKNADKAKEWTDWFKDLQDAPDEIQDLNEKTTQARETITQIQELIKTRPDLLEGASGEKLKEKIGAAIKSTDTALGKMNKMLADLSTKGAKEGDGNVAHGLEKYWNSYRYRDEWQDKIKAADNDLQKELASLGALMSGIYSKALSKPVPIQSAAVPAAPESDGKTAVPALVPAAAPATVAAATVPTVVSPPPPPADADAARSTAVQDIQATAPQPTVVPATNIAQPVPINPVTASPPPVAEATHPPEDRPPPPTLLAATEGVPTPPIVDPPAPRHQSIADVAASERRPRNPSIAEAAVADMGGFSPTAAAVHRGSADISPMSSPPPPRPSSVAREEAAIGSPPPTEPRNRRSSAAVPPVAAAYMSTPPPVVPTTGGAPIDPRRRSSVSKTAKESADSITSDLAPQDILLDAAWEGDIDAVAHALRRAPASSCDLKGHTPLHLACERDHLAVAILLLDRGADVHARSDGGRMALHLAARFASADMVEMLLERAKADPDARTSEGRTALHYAASAARDGNEERREVIRVLRDWGADPTITDRKSKLPRDVAQARDHWDAASTLRRAEKKWEEEHKQGWLQRHGFLKK